MATGHVFIATSLDGFVARQDRSLDWLMKQDQQGEDLGYDKFVSQIDGIVMGRGSFETVLGFDAWPYELPVAVMSRSMAASAVPEALRERVHITDAAPRAVMESVAEKGWKRVYIDGGLVVQSFLRDGLIDDLVVTTIPILIGSGVRLFGELDEDIDLDLVSSASFSSGAVQSHYRVRPSGSA